MNEVHELFRNGQVKPWMAFPKTSAKVIGRLSKTENLAVSRHQGKCAGMDGKVEVWRIVRVGRKLEHLRNALNMNGRSLEMVEQGVDAFWRDSWKLRLEPRHRKDVADLVKHVR